MKKNFQFIDSTKNDKSTRRLARSHAMKGKNIGKTHNRRSRTELCRWHEYKQPALVPVTESRHYQESFGSLMKSSQGLTYNALSNDLRFVSFPVEVTLQNQTVFSQFFTIVINALYSPQLVRPLDHIMSQWMQPLLVDKTSFHCSLALLATLTGFFSGRVGISYMATYHLSQAVILVNQKLDTSEALSNSNIMVVGAMIMQEILRGSRSTAEVHLKGLQKMIRLRGGLSQLEEDKLIVLKICRTDLDYALHYGTSPCFYRDRMPDVTLVLAQEGIIMKGDVVNSKIVFNRTDPFLRQILLDVANLASIFNNKDYTDFRLEPLALQEIIISVGYRLLQFHALHGPQLQNQLESAYHIGATAFLTTLFIQSCHRHFYKYELISQCLRDIIDRGLGEEDNDLMLWLLFIGGISVITDLDQTWLLSKIRQSVQLMDIKSWEELRQRLVQFLWLKCLHDEEGKALWDSIVSEDTFAEIAYDL